MTRMSKACRETWISTIDTESMEIIFLGDTRMPAELDGHEVYKPLKHEPKFCRDNITRKMVRAYEYILTKEWDFVVRSDNDVYCNVSRLVDFLGTKKPTDDLYAGQGIHYPDERRKNYLSNVGDRLPPPKWKYYYAQGGFYIISRSALEKSVTKMYFPAPLVDWAEDVMVGESLERVGVSLEDRPDLFNAGFVGKGWPRMGTRQNTADEHLDIMRSGYISTHKVSPPVMYRIHNMFNK